MTLLCPRAPDHAFPSDARLLRRTLHGRVRVPGDKSISHRALIFGALSVGETAITGLLEGEDVINTGRAMRALGATVERIGEGALARRRRRRRRLRASPPTPLDFGNSGTGCAADDGRGRRLRRSPRTFDGDACLRKRPMQRILDPLQRMGAPSWRWPKAGGCR